MTQTLAELQLVWQKARVDLVSQSDLLLVEASISTRAQFATAAWRNRIRAWCLDLDEMISEYAPRTTGSEGEMTKKPGALSAFEQGQLAFREVDGKIVENPFEEGSPQRNNFDVGKRFAAAHAAPHERHLARVHSGEEN